MEEELAAQQSAEALRTANADRIERCERNRKQKVLALRAQERGSGVALPGCGAPPVCTHNCKRARFADDSGERERENNGAQHRV